MVFASLTICAASAGVGEGIEEMLEKAFDPAIEAITYNPEAINDYANADYYAEMMYDGLLGGILGTLGGGFDVAFKTKGVYGDYKTEVKNDAEWNVLKTAPETGAVESDTQNYIYEVHHGEILDTLRPHVPELADMSPVKHLSGNEFQKSDTDTRNLRTKVIEFFNSIGNRVVRADIGEISLNNAGAHDSLGHGYGKLKAATFAALPEVLEDGKILSVDPKYNGRPYKSYLIGAPVKVGKDTVCVGALVIQDSNTQRYKVHEVLTISEEGALSFKTETTQNGEHLRDNPPSTGTAQTTDTEASAQTSENGNANVPADNIIPSTPEESNNNLQEPDPFTATALRGLENQEQNRKAALDAATRNVGVETDAQERILTEGIIRRLNNGEDVSNDEINSIPRMREVLSREVKDTSQINTPERQALRADRKNRLMALGSYSGVDSNGDPVYNGIVDKGYRVDVVIGVPAAGKSTVLVNPLSQANNARVIDSDMAKELLPEYDNGKGAADVHRESGNIRAEMLRETLRAGENFVFPTVGDNLDSLLVRIQAFKDAGYSVYLHLNELSPTKAKARALQRFLQPNGRYTPLFIIDEAGTKPTENYEYIKSQGGLIDGYSRYSNDVPKGQPARRVEEVHSVRGLETPDTPRHNGGLLQGRGQAGFASVPGNTSGTGGKTGTGTSQQAETGLERETPTPNTGEASISFIVARIDEVSQRIAEIETEADHNHRDVDDIQQAIVEILRFVCYNAVVFC